MRADLPAADATVVTMLPENAALPVVGRTADGEWLQVELPQGATAWIFRATIIPRGDVNGVAVSDGTGAGCAGGDVATPEPQVEAPTEVPAEGLPRSPLLRSPPAECNPRRGRGRYGTRGGSVAPRGGDSAMPRSWYLCSALPVQTA